ncbi:MAG TPA: ribonuclease P protein component [Candidatus Saccharimonadales bacterium]|nr:ribonuclease P protein component [Candidatus Saccharimonadales bacterium]
MIPKKNRFIGNNAIDRVYKTTRPLRAGGFNIRAKKSSSGEYRLAVVVSKKVSKSAVVRNRIRRRIFEYARQNIANRPNAAGKEIIITVFEESTATIPAEDLTQQLKKLFKKAGIN